MLVRSSIVGALFTLVLVTLLALSRLATSEPEIQMLVTEIETIDLTSPPPPPEFSEPEEEPEDIPPPPSPNIDIPMDLPPLDTPQITTSLQNIPLTSPLQIFHTAAAPAALPIVKAKPTTRKKAPSPKRKITRTAVKQVKVETSKAYYSASELDSSPRQRYIGKFRWPSSAKGTTGSVKLHIEINTSGRVCVLNVVSSTNPGLNQAAIKLATGSKFTTPTRGGKPVKARFYKTYTLKKPS
ncbi:MAG: energy transducer TonB [Akkermansiaceae bacterium]